MLSFLLGLLAQCSHKFARKWNYLLVSRAVLLAGALKRSRGVYNRALWWSLSGENKKRIFMLSLLLVLSAQCLHNVAHKLKYQLVSPCFTFTNFTQRAWRSTIWPRGSRITLTAQLVSRPQGIRCTCCTHGGRWGRISARRAVRANNACTRRSILASATIEAGGIRDGSRLCRVFTGNTTDTWASACSKV